MNQATAQRYAAEETNFGWAVIDTVANAIVSGAESEGMAREIAAEYETKYPDGIDVDEVVG